MPSPSSKFIIKSYDNIGGNFVDSDYIFHYEGNKPAMLEGALQRIFSSQSNFFNAKPLTALTNTTPGGVVEIDTEIFRWVLQGAEYKQATSIENLEINNPAPGLNGTTFRIKLDLDFYRNPDVLFSEDNDFPIAIVDGPIADGAGSIYVCKLQTDNPEAYLPPYLLDAGRKFNKVWTSVQSEFNERYGTIQLPSSFQLESQLGFFAQGYTVTDKALRNSSKLGIKFLYTDSSGKSSQVEKFIPTVDAIHKDTFYKSMEVQAMYGKKSTKKGDSDYWIKTGPGVREQLKDSWVMHRSGPITTEMFMEYFLDIFVSRVDEGNRDAHLMTGTVGAIDFHKAVAKEASSFLTMDTLFTRVNSENPRFLTFGAEYTEYQGPQSIKLKLIKNPMYDSMEFCKTVSPMYPSLPSDSGRYTILDLGATQGSPNLVQVKEKNTFSFGYVPGTVTPNGAIQGGMGASRKAGYDVWMQGSFGIVVKDVTRCGEIIPLLEY